MAVVRHKGKRHYLGTFETIDGASEQVSAFRKEHPLSITRRWQPGDKL